MSKSPHPIDAHVGNRVRFRRMMLGVSQEKLGEQLGLTFQQVQKYEKGANRIGASRLYRIAQVLGVSVEFFFDEIPDDVEDTRSVERLGAKREPAPQLMGFIGSAEGVQLNASFARIDDPDVRKRVLELVKALAPQEAASRASMAVGFGRTA